MYELFCETDDERRNENANLRDDDDRRTMYWNEYTQPSNERKLYQGRIEKTHMNKLFLDSYFKEKTLQNKNVNDINDVTSGVLKLIGTRSDAYDGIMVL